jgi:hypothetical protein
VLIAGDVQSNPGPTDHSVNEHDSLSVHKPIVLENNSKISYDRKQLLSLNHVGSRVSLKLWHNLRKLGISAMKPTHRGCAGGKNRKRCETSANRNSTTRGASPSSLPVIFMTNAQSLVNKMDEINIILRQERVNILVSSETWFRTKLSPCQMNIDGVNLYSKFREDRRGGGVGIYVNQEIPSKLLDIVVPVDLECIWVEVRPTRLPRGVSAITLCAVYIVTDSPLQPVLEKHLIDVTDDLRTRYPEMGFCILGDFNRMDINTIIRGNELEQIITFPTRGKATLDLVITNLRDHYTSPQPLILT